MLRAFVCVCVCFAVGTNGAPAEDLITDLPGWDASEGPKMYSGYITVDEAHQRKLFYWFVSAAEGPATAPVTLWMNGGPGCSSVGGGLMTEQGPFRPDANGKLQPNPYGWHTASNMIFLESPAGVGFSFSENSTDYTVGDKRTIQDVHSFLTQFFTDKFPELAGNPFWVSGESYAGHYTPLTTQAIADANARAALTGAPTINLKGMLVGNAWTDAAFDNRGATEYWFSHRLISYDTYNGLLTCNFSNVGPLALMADSRINFPVNPHPEDDACDAAQKKAFVEMGNINIYDVYADVCVTSGARRLTPDSQNAAGCAASYEPCIDDYTQTYLRREDVQRAIHANLSLPTPWSSCSSVVDYSRESLLTSMLPVYRDLVTRNLSLLVFSGDIDAIVPVLGTVNWLHALGQPITTALRPWYVDDQVGGRIEEYSGGLSFTTVRSGGHMVPATAASRGLHMFKSWINGTPL